MFCGSSSGAFVDYLWGGISWSPLKARFIIGPSDDEGVPHASRYMAPRLAIPENRFQRTEHGPHARPLLLTADADLLRRQDESKGASITQLNQVGPLRLADGVRVIDTVASRGVQHGTAGAKYELNAVNGEDGPGHIASHGDVLAQRRDVLGAVPAYRGEKVLAVAVPVDEELDTRLVTKPIDQCVHSLHLWSVCRRGALVSL